LPRSDFVRGYRNASVVEERSHRVSALSDYRHRVRDPVHGFIRFSDQEKHIINSNPFQRLRRIRQLSTTSFVYPGAVHTRFEHSLGVMELATRMFRSIKRNTVPSLWQGWWLLP